MRGAWETGVVVKNVFTVCRGKRCDGQLTFSLWARVTDVMFTYLLTIG